MVYRQFIRDHASGGREDSECLGPLRHAWQRGRVVRGLVRRGLLQDLSGGRSRRAVYWLGPGSAGGSWFIPATAGRSADRDGRPPVVRSFGLGFRVALAVGGKAEPPREAK